MNSADLTAGFETLIIVLLSDASLYTYYIRTATQGTGKGSAPKKLESDEHEHGHGHLLLLLFKFKFKFNCQLATGNVQYRQAFASSVKPGDIGIVKYAWSLWCL